MKKFTHEKLKVIDYWWEGSTSIAILPFSASNVVGQH